MAEIEIEGEKYKVVEELGFDVAGKEKMVVRPAVNKEYRQGSERR